MKRLLLAILICTTALAATAQTLKVLPSGIKYKILKNGGSKKKARIGDYIVVKMRGTVSGIEIFSTKKMNKGQDAPVNFNVTKPQMRGDVMEGFTLLGQNDSAIFYVPQDSFFRNPGSKPKGAKLGDDVIYVVKVLQVLSPAEYTKQQQDYKKQMAEMKKFQAQQAKLQEQQRKAQLAAKAQIKKDDAAILAYFASNGISNYKKTASGMYYVVTKPGTGEKPKVGNEVVANYTGQLLNGTKFDSNVDTAFGHVSPFAFPVGQSRVIAAWDEAFGKILSKGESAMLLIPSAMGYGAAGSPPKIPANSVLRFDVDFVDFKEKKTPQQIAAEQEAFIKDYLAANNITDAKRTASGVYYRITKEGNGPLPAKGDNMTVNYVSKTFDGRAFDSNLDSTFGHMGDYGFFCSVGQVPAGIDESVALLNKGAKATFYIPSALGFGERGANGIGPDMPFIYEAELVNFVTPAPVPDNPTPLPDLPNGAEKR
jgi:FKBP-type peptidyl-prolyl cis-trans isomerase FkpA